MNPSDKIRKVDAAKIFGIIDKVVEKFPGKDVDLIPPRKDVDFVEPKKKADTKLHRKVVAQGVMGEDKPRTIDEAIHLMIEKEKQKRNSADPSPYVITSDQEGMEGMGDPTDDDGLTPAAKTLLNNGQGEKKQ